MAAAHRLRTRRLELLAATSEMLEAEMLGREALSRRLRARVPDEWPPEGFDRSFVEWAAGVVRRSPGDAGWLVWYQVLDQEPAGDEAPDETPGGGAERTVIGTCGFKGRPSPDGIVEIGYSVLPAFRRLGLTTEAVSAILDWAFIHRSVASVIAETATDHIASVSVLEKNGFRPSGPGVEEGTVRYLLPRGDHQASRLKRQLERRTDSAGTPGPHRPRSKAPPCPRCGSRDVAAIAYGLPDPTMFESARKGEIELGGCLISDQSPRWRCRACESEWGRVMGPEDEPPLEKD